MLRDMGYDVVPEPAQPGSFYSVGSRFSSGKAGKRNGRTNLAAR